MVNHGPMKHFYQRYYLLKNDPEAYSVYLPNILIWEDLQ